MLKRILLLITICALLFSGCHAISPKDTALASIGAPTEAIPAAGQAWKEAITPTVVSTATYAAAAHAEALAASSPTALPATAYPAPAASATEELAYPAPASTLTPIPAALPYSDCARTPGIPICAPPAPGLAGRVAFYDTEKNRLVGIDLKTGQGWTVSMPQPKKLEWSPDGSQLLVRVNFPTKQSEVYEYLLFRKDGKLIRQFARDRNLDWQPQGGELRAPEEPKIARSPNGAEAWLERTDRDKTLHFRTSGTTAWETAVLDISPMDWFPEVYGWIPGTSSLLITQSSGSVYNNVTFGDHLYMFNTQTGEFRSLGLNGHMNSQSAALRGSDLAVIRLNWGIADETLAILDSKTGDISYPLPHEMGGIQSYSIWQFTWQPGKSGDGGLFAMMVKVFPDRQAPSLFPKSGIYLYNRITGQSQVVRETPENVMGGNFYWTADGQYLLYSVGSDNPDQKTPASLYARQISTGKEWMLIDRLISPDVFLSYISWNLIAVHMELEGQ